MHWNEKLSHFDILNSGVTGGTKIWTNFLGKIDSIFLSMHRKKKMCHFDLKSWVTGGSKIRLNFLGQNDSILSLNATTEKIELIS